jgi:fatty-acyl-CoA synthase
LNDSGDAGTLATTVALARRHVLGDLLRRSAALYEHEGVAEVAVVGVPHPTWIEAVVAIVVRRHGMHVDAGELRAHVRGRLAGFKVPKAFAFVETMPKNPSGKLRKRELRSQFAFLANEIPSATPTAAPTP